MATDNPLSAFYRGFQGAQKAAQAQEQQQVENELSRRLREIQAAQLQRQITEASKPLNERILEAVLMGAAQRGEIIPGQTSIPAVAEVVAPVTQAPLGETAGIPSGLQIPGLSEALAQITSVETPVLPSLPAAPTSASAQIPGIPAGFTFNPEASTQRAIRLAESRRTQAPPGFRIVTDENGFQQLVQVSGSGAGTGTAIPVRTETGEGLKAAPRTATTRSLTANAQANILAKAGEARITQEEIESKYTKDGVTDWNKLIIDSNKKLSEDKSIAAEKKLTQIPAAERAKATGFIAAHKGLTRLIGEVNKFKVQGREPDAWNRAVATALEAPPDGVFSALYQSAIGQSLTADEQTLNALKAMVRSAVTKANAGLSQTEREIANVSQYVPKSNDTIEETLRKGALLETYLIDQVESITTDPKEWLGSINQPGESVPSGTPTPQGAIQIRSIRRKQ